MSIADKKWKPGDVAMIVTPRTSFLAWKRTGDDLWVDQEGVEFSTASPLSGDWPVRPLVVIDPEDREQVERLRLGLFGTSSHAHGIEQMQQILREFANPTPRIEEPTGVGAVVLDDGGEQWVNLTRSNAHVRPWVRLDDPYEWRDFEDISAVRVLSPGVEVSQ